MTPLDLAAVAVVLLVVTAAVLATALVRVSRRSRRDVRDAQAEVEVVRRQLSELDARLAGLAARTPPDPILITDAGAPTDAGTVVPDRLVLSATLGEPLVRSAALVHGLRRALSAPSRHQIRFEVRQEVRRARKQRRKDTRDAWRRHRAELVRPSREAPTHRATERDESADEDAA